MVYYKTSKRKKDCQWLEKMRLVLFTWYRVSSFSVVKVLVISYKQFKYGCFADVHSLKSVSF